MAAGYTRVPYRNVRFVTYARSSLGTENIRAYYEGFRRREEKITISLWKSKTEIRRISRMCRFLESNGEKGGIYR